MSEVDFLVEGHIKEDGKDSDTVMAEDGSRSTQMEKEENVEDAKEIEKMEVSEADDENDVDDDNEAGMEEDEDEDDLTLSQIRESSPVPTKKRKPRAVKQKTSPLTKKKKVSMRRAPSAFTLFFRDTQPAVKHQRPEAKFSEVHRAVKDLWETMDVAMKKKYEDQSAKLREECRLANQEALKTTKVPAKKPTPKRKPVAQKATPTKEAVPTQKESPSPEKAVPVQLNLTECAQSSDESSMSSGISDDEPDKPLVQQKPGTLVTTIRLPQVARRGRAQLGRARRYRTAAAAKTDVDQEHSTEQKADNAEQNPDSIEQKADSTEQQADSIEQKPASESSKVAEDAAKLDTRDQDEAPNKRAKSNREVSPVLSVESTKSSAESTEAAVTGRKQYPLRSKLRPPPTTWSASKENEEEDGEEEEDEQVDDEKGDEAFVQNESDAQDDSSNSNDDLLNEAHALVEAKKTKSKPKKKVRKVTKAKGKPEAKPEDESNDNNVEKHQNGSSPKVKENVDKDTKNEKKSNTNASKVEDKKSNKKEDKPPKKEEPKEEKKKSVSKKKGLKPSQLCIRDSCHNLAIASPAWDGEYCSDSCVVLHARETFQNWLSTRQAQPA